MYRLLPIVAAIFLFSCNKTTPPKENNTTVEVRESGGGAPVNNASIVLFQSTLGGLGYKEYFSGKTNQNGTCEVPSKYFSDPLIEFNVVAEKYWPYIIPTQRSSKVTLQPEGWVKVQLGQPANPYPDNSRIRLYAISKTTGYSDALYEKESALTVGTTLTVRAFGNEMNTLFFQITDASNQILAQGQSQELNVPKFDTVAVSWAGY